MKYWLFKSEPETFSIDHLSQRPKQTEPWDGVRNFQVRNMLKNDIKIGDLAFFYHSSCKVPGVAGVIEIVKNGYPDSTAFDRHSKYYDARSTPDKPMWYRVDVKLKEKFTRLIPLSELKEVPALQDMIILRKGNRLSITSLTKKEWDSINKIAHQ